MKLFNALKTNLAHCDEKKLLTSLSFQQNGIVLQIQYTLGLRKPELRKNLDLRKIVSATDFLVHKLFDLRKIS